MADFKRDEDKRERFSGSFSRALDLIPETDRMQIKKHRRIQKVRQMWACLVPQVLLDHTNSVFVFDKNGRKQMHVYVDEGIFAAELNNQRELIKLQCAQNFGEIIDDFYIHVSKGKYKDLHPYRQPSQENTFVPLDDCEISYVEQVSADISDHRLRESFKKAMISDLERKKSENC